MTLLVLTVFPAPDSPLTHTRAHLGSQTQDTKETTVVTYVISIDWFSRSVEQKEEEGK